MLIQYVNDVLRSICSIQSPTLTKTMSNSYLTPSVNPLNQRSHSTHIPNDIRPNRLTHVQLDCNQTIKYKLQKILRIHTTTNSPQFFKKTSITRP
ncbi:hypothetical protein BC829DRAFT_390215 [Chytridium lagenaria]|nr:hypothetical protein BC829DRAFT_390215 [Chytridium lagenaria]